MKATTPINIERLQVELANHPDKDFVKYLIDGLRNGFDIFMGDDVNIDISYECRNLKTAREDPHTVEQLINTEVKKGYLVGPLHTLPFSNYRVSPIGIATGKYSGKKRLILDLSSPHENSEIDSINDLIDKDKCSLRYVKVDDAIKKIQELGRNAILCKTDISDAFKLIPVKPELWHLLCIKWENQYYYFVRLPFGSRSSPRIFDCLSQAVVWIAKNNYDIDNMFHLLDDFLTIDKSDTIGERTMALLCTLFKRLNIPLSMKKTEGPTQCLEYLGIILDTNKMEARLPLEKVDRICKFVKDFLNCRSVTKRQLLQLLGHFNFAARVILPGRPFTSHLIALSTTVDNLNFYVKFDRESREDLHMWLEFLEKWNGVSVFYEKTLTSNADFQLYTDASSTIGYGGYFHGHWFAECWPKELTTCMKQPISMAFRELYPIVVAALLWGHMWRRKRILFHCDNSAVVEIIKKRRSSDLPISNLMRTLCYCAAKNNFDVYSEHVPGITNIIADSLSRLQIPRFRQAAPLADQTPTPCPDISQVMWSFNK
jgi:hypothetical protein